MKLVQTLRSEIDHSVNFVFSTGQEARYVRREDYLVVYLSSHGGCDKACRFCHLTQSGQTDLTPTTAPEFKQQFDQVFAHYVERVVMGYEEPVKKMHINFMARGEPLSHPLLSSYWSELSEHWVNTALDMGIETVKAKISTIFPTDAPTHLHYDGWVQPAIYYSLYSLSPAFRKKWLPKALDPIEALERLRDWQISTDGQVTIHGALIEGENDSVQDAKDITSALEELGVTAKLNIVRYNPYSSAQGAESDLHTRVQYINQIRRSNNVEAVKTVQRLGMDVKAACGTFV